MITYFLTLLNRFLLERYAQRLAFERHEVKPGACRFGHEKKKERIQTGMDTAQTHCHIKVHIQGFRSIHKQLDIMDKV